MSSGRWTLLPVEDPPAPRRSAAVPILLGVVIALLAGFAIVAALASSGASDDAKRIGTEAAAQRAKATDLASAGSNRAVTDSALTSDVSGELKRILERVLSYDYADLDTTAKAAGEGLTGKARCQYDALYGQVRQSAAAQKLVLTTTVHEIGFTELSTDQASALVFLDQTSSRGDTRQSSQAGAQLTLQAQRQAGHWQVTGFDLLGQPPQAGTSSPSC